MIGVSCPRKINFIAKKELFSIPILSGILKGFGAVSVDRGNGDIAAIKKSVSLLEEGNVVCIFPQGHRYPKVDPATTPHRNGAAMIAYRADVPIIPVSIKTRGLKYSLFKEVEVIFGKPITTKELGIYEGGNKEYASATDQIMNIISVQAEFPSDDTLLSSEEEN
jgi:1-acyl-sn-glycerol-3-phosphate acyltransferase